MRLLAVGIVSAACIVVLLTGALAFQIFRGGFSARAEPSAFEATVARRLRLLAIPTHARQPGAVLGRGPLRRARALCRPLRSLPRCQR